MEKEQYKDEEILENITERILFHADDGREHRYAILHQIQNHFAKLLPEIQTSKKEQVIQIVQRFFDENHAVFNEASFKFIIDELQNCLDLAEIYIIYIQTLLVNNNMLLLDNIILMIKCANKHIHPRVFLDIGMRFLPSTLDCLILISNFSDAGYTIPQDNIATFLKQVPENILEVIYIIKIIYRYSTFPGFYDVMFDIITNIDFFGIITDFSLLPYKTKKRILQIFNIYPIYYLCCANNEFQTNIRTVLDIVKLSWDDIMNSYLSDDEDDQDIEKFDEIIFPILLEIYCYLKEAGINEENFISTWSEKLNYGFEEDGETM